VIGHDHPGCHAVTAAIESEEHFLDGCRHTSILEKTFAAPAIQILLEFCAPLPFAFDVKESFPLVPQRGRHGIGQAEGDHLNCAGLVEMRQVPACVPTFRADALFDSGFFRLARALPLSPVADELVNSPVGFAFHRSDGRGGGLDLREHTSRIDAPLRIICKRKKRNGARTFLSARACDVFGCARAEKEVGGRSPDTMGVGGGRALWRAGGQECPRSVGCGWVLGKVGHGRALWTRKRTGMSALLYLSKCVPA
jgi:hypothetical protein